MTLEESYQQEKRYRQELIRKASVSGITPPPRSNKTATASAPQPKRNTPEPATVNVAEFRRRLGFSLATFLSWRGQNLVPAPDAILSNGKEPKFSGKGEPMWRESTVNKFLHKLGKTTSN